MQLFTHIANKMYIQIHEKNMGINQKYDTHSWLKKKEKTRIGIIRLSDNVENIYTALLSY